MLITRIETIPLKVPVRPELAIKARAGMHTESPFVLVKIHTLHGLVGLGEVSCTPRWSGEDQATAAHLITAYIAPALVGQDALDRERLTAVMDRVLAGNPFTKAGIEMALWDLAGKYWNLPVYRLLGGAVRERVATKWSISGLDPARATEIVAHARSLGFTTMKVKVGLDPDADVARVQAVREALGAGVRLGVDANGGWDAWQAVPMIHRLEKFDIFFAEQPVPPRDPWAMAQVRRRIHVPVLADESVYNAADALALIRCESADAFSIYVGKSGGIGPARNIAAIAHAAGIPCTIGSNLEMGIASAAMAHLGLAAPGIQADAFPCDIIGPFYYGEDIVAEPITTQGGWVRPSEKPGLGVELNEGAVARYRIDR